MEKQTEQFKDAVKEYLDSLAAIDDAFAAKLANPEKSLDKCVEFIQSEIFHKYIKERHGSVATAAPSREECFGLAVHYYDEENIEIRKMSGVASAGSFAPKVELTEEDKEAAKQRALEAYEREQLRKIQDRERKEKEAARKKAQEAAAGMDSLFDF